jgi:hypothetical protein
MNTARYGPTPCPDGLTRPETEGRSHEFDHHPIEPLAGELAPAYGPAGDPYPQRETVLMTSIATGAASPELERLCCHGVEGLRAGRQRILDRAFGHVRQRH